MFFESTEPFSFLDFFAGSGLVTEGVKPHFKTVWANDISNKKAAVFLANQDSTIFHLAPLQFINPNSIPPATVSWASFPCQDLSLAGKKVGINGYRSGLFWTWLDVMDRMTKSPPILVAENVNGITSSNKGANYRLVHEALTDRGYLVGPIMLDALHWLPQSRKRIFIIAFHKSIDCTNLIDEKPNWLHPNAITNAVQGLSSIVWWKLEQPSSDRVGLSDLVDFDAQTDDESKSEYNLSLIPPQHMQKLLESARKGLHVFPGYKRIRNGNQVLEIRNDNISGCLRTANGGSSREYLVINQDNKLSTRLLTVRETARLMGAPDSYKIPGSYNDGYSAMGDAVALPVSQFISTNLLLPLSRRYHANYRRIIATV